MKNYHFTVKLSGWGNTPQEAWEDLLEEVGYNLSDEMPEEYELVDEEVDEQLPESICQDGSIAI